MKRLESGWRWSNFPIPGPHLVLAGIGVLLGVFWPLEMKWGGRWLSAAGVVLGVMGIALMVWATAAAGRVNLAEPDSLVTSGPYGMSRHPMYVAWALVYLGVAAVLSTWWLLILLPVLAAWIHWDSSREEERMVETFGSAYEAYQVRVRRYV